MEFMKIADRNVVELVVHGETIYRCSIQDLHFGKKCACMVFILYLVALPPRTQQVTVSFYHLKPKFSACWCEFCYNAQKLKLGVFK